MSEATAVLESSPDVPVMEVERGPLVNLTGDQRAEFRKTGELPKVEPKKAEAAASSSEAKTEEVETESAGEPGTPEKQEHTERKPRQTAAERIAELKATIAKIEKGAGIKTQAESSTAKPEPKPQPVPLTRTKPTPEDKKADGTPKFETYEDYIEDLTDWKGEQRDAKNQRESAQQAQARELNSKLEDARSRYDKFDEVMKPTVDAIVDDPQINQAVKAMLNDSDYLPDLIFTIGSDSAELAKFVKMAKDSPGKALRYIALTESLIAEELAGKPESKESPAKPKTLAPKPPIEAGGRGTTPPDGLEAAAKANDFRAFKAEATRRQLAKLKS